MGPPSAGRRVVARGPGSSAGVRAGARADPAAAANRCAGTSDGAVLRRAAAVALRPGLRRWASSRRARLAPGRRVRVECVHPGYGRDVRSRSRRGAGDRTTAGRRRSAGSTVFVIAARCRRIAVPDRRPRARRGRSSVQRCGAQRRAVRARSAGAPRPARWTRGGARGRRSSATGRIGVARPALRAAGAGQGRNRGRRALPRGVARGAPRDRGQRRHARADRTSARRLRRHGSRCRGAQGTCGPRRLATPDGPHGRARGRRSADRLALLAGGRLGDWDSTDPLGRAATRSSDVRPAPPYPRFSDAEMKRRRAALADAMAEPEVDARARLRREPRRARRWAGSRAGRSRARRSWCTRRGARPAARQLLQPRARTPSGSRPRRTCAGPGRQPMATADRGAARAAARPGARIG